MNMKVICKFLRDHSLIVKLDSIFESQLNRKPSVHSKVWIVSVNSYISEPFDLLAPSSTVDNEHLISQVNLQPQ